MKKSYGLRLPLMALAALMIGSIGSAELTTQPLLCGQDIITTLTSKSVNPCNLTGGPVGIGTMNPQAQLDVLSQDLVPLQVRSTAKLARMILEGALGSEVVASASSNEKYLALQAAGSIQQGAYVRLFGSESLLATTGKGSVVVGSAGAAEDGDILFQTRQQDRLIIDQSGRIGIGTLSPLATLQIASDLALPLRVETRASVATLELEGAIGSVISASAGATGKFLALQAAPSIDTGATIALLGSEIEGTGTGRGSILIESARSSRTGDILFRTMGLSRLIIDQDGRLGIGTTEPKEQLHVTENLLVGGQIRCSGRCIEPGAIRGLQVYVPLTGSSKYSASPDGFQPFDSVWLGRDLLPADGQIRLYVKLTSAGQSCWEIRFGGVSQQGCGQPGGPILLELPYEIFSERASEHWLEYRVLTPGAPALIEKAWLVVINP